MTENAKAVCLVKTGLDILVPNKFRRPLRGHELLEETEILCFLIMRAYIEDRQSFNRNKIPIYSVQMLPERIMNNILILRSDRGTDEGSPLIYLSDRTYRR